MQIARLPEVAQIIMGQSPPSDTYNEVGNGLPFFQGKAEFGEVSPIPRKWCANPKKIAEAGDILISVRAPVGPTNLAVERCCIGRGLAAIRADANRLNLEYLRFFLRYAEPMLASMGQGSTFAAIGRTELASISMQLPPLDEQRRIVDIISRAEGIVRLRREAQNKTAEITPSLFIDMFGDPLTNPKELPRVELGRFLSFITSGSRGWAKYYSPEGDRFIRSLDVRMNSISDESAVFVNAPLGAEADRTRVLVDDVLLTITGSQIGRVAPVLENLAGAFVSQHVAILRLKSDLSPKFLSMYLSLETGGQREIARLQYGQTKPGLSLQQIPKFMLLVPSIMLQNKFADKLEQLQSIQSQQSAATAKAEATFNALLSRAFQGGLGLP